MKKSSSPSVNDFLCGEEENVPSEVSSVKEDFPPSTIVPDAGSVEEDREVKEGTVVGSTSVEVLQGGSVSVEEGGASLFSCTALREERISAPGVKTEFCWGVMDSAASFFFVKKKMWLCVNSLVLLLKMQKTFVLLWWLPQS